MVDLPVFDLSGEGNADWLHETPGARESMDEEIAILDELRQKVGSPGEQLQEYNPYHDKAGRFTSKSKAIGSAGPQGALRGKKAKDFHEPVGISDPEDLAEYAVIRSLPEVKALVSTMKQVGPVLRRYDPKDGTPATREQGEAYAKLERAMSGAWEAASAARNKPDGPSGRWQAQMRTEPLLAMAVLQRFGFTDKASSDTKGITDIVYRGSTNFFLKQLGKPMNHPGSGMLGPGTYTTKQRGGARRFASGQRADGRAAPLGLRVKPSERIEARTLSYMKADFRKASGKPRAPRWGDSMSDSAKTFLAAAMGYRVIDDPRYPQTVVIDRSALVLPRSLREAHAMVYAVDGDEGLARLREGITPIDREEMARLGLRGFGPGRPRKVYWSTHFGTPKQQRYAAAWLAILDSIGDMQAADRARVLMTFARYREELTLAMADLAADPTREADGFASFRIDSLMRAVDEVTGRFQRRYASAQAAALRRHWLAGQRAAPWAFRQSGLEPPPLTGLSLNQIEAASMYSAKLVKHVTDDTRRKVDNIIFQIVLGGDDRWSAQQKLATLLDPAPWIGTGDPRQFRTGVGFARSPLAQAETVLRTETGRVFSLANQARVEQLGEQMAGMQKMWIHSGNMNEPRKYHIETLHGTVVAYDEDFNVNGFDAKGPRDARLPASEVINCGCRVVPWYAGWDDSWPEQQAAMQEEQAELRQQWIDEYQSDLDQEDRDRYMDYVEGR